MKPLMKDDELKSLVKLTRALTTFKIVNEKMPLQYVLSFLAVATDEGKGVLEYANKLNVSNSTMSRHLLDIGPRNRNMEPGYGLVQYRANPMELRKHEYYVTPKGRQLLTHIIRALESDK